MLRAARFFYLLRQDNRLRSRKKKSVPRTPDSAEQTAVHQRWYGNHLHYFNAWLKRRILSSKTAVVASQLTTPASNSLPASDSQTTPTPGSAPSATTDTSLDSMNRLLNTLSAIDRMIVRAKDREHMCDQICRILVDSGKFRMAWIGLADFTSGRVIPAASAGITGDYLRQAHIRCDDTPEGQGPTGRAIRLGVRQINNDTETDSNYGPWRERARQMNYRSSGAFPIQVGDRTIGAINVYAQQAGAFSSEVLHLLDEMAHNIGFAMQGLDTIQQREQAKRELQELNSQLEARVAERTQKLQTEISERKRQQLLVESWAAREKILVDLLRLGLRQIELDDYLAEALRLVTMRIAWPGPNLEGAIFLDEPSVDGRSGVPRLVASTGIGPDAAIKSRLQSAVQRCLGESGGNSKGVCMFFGRELGKEIAAEADSRYYGIPIYNQEDCHGVLLLQAAAHTNASNNELPFLEQIASAISLSISNSLAQRRLVAARKDAESANNAKSEFLARMSHELRTPLNAILGFGQLLQMDENGLSKDQRSGVHYIMDSGRHLLNLINEVLDIAKVDAGAIGLSPQAVVVSDALHDALPFVAPLAQQRNIRIIIEDHAELPAVHADPLRLKQVLINILSNAIKYNHAGGSVRIVCEAAAPDAAPIPGERLRIACIDSGIGISNEDLQRIFEPFQHIGTPSGQVDSIGVGLAISRKLVELMAGRIGVDSQLGQGSTFWIELPVHGRETTVRSAQSG